MQKLCLERADILPIPAGVDWRSSDASAAKSQERPADPKHPCSTAFEPFIGLGGSRTVLTVLAFAGCCVPK